MANGLYSNTELITSIIGDLNSVLQAQAGGEHLKACAVMTGVVQKLVNLRQHVDDDLKNRDETIDSLKAKLRACGVEIIEVAPENLMNEGK